MHAQIKSFARRLVREDSGTTIIEFAILAPAIIGMMLGVMQIGLSMQSYNAMRSVAADAARMATIEYQKKNEIQNWQIRNRTKDIATGAPYLFQNSVVVTVDSVTPSRVSGAYEKTLTIKYTPPTVIALIDFVQPEITYSRPIFLIDE